MGATSRSYPGMRFELDAVEPEDAELAVVAGRIRKANLARGARVWSARFEFREEHAAEAVTLFLRERAVGAYVDGAPGWVFVEFHASLVEAIVARALALGGALGP